MCDTFVYVPHKEENANIIFGKNSDREPNEAQAIIRIPAQKHKSENLKCTYIEIPQVKETYEVILSKPFQMWGAEMGANEHDLVIGNEAVFTKVKITKNNSGLTGMDLIRLALERAKSADTALELITNLIEKYSQNANGGYKNELYYHNSFIIADKTKAWVLETAGKHWVAKKVNGYRSISNRLTIGEEFDLSSNGIKDYALKKGESFHFAKTFSDWFYTYFSKSAMRYEKSCAIGLNSSNFNVHNAIKILSSHYVEGSKFEPSKMYNGGSVCMHSTDFTNPSQSVGSMIAEIRKDTLSTFWFTGTSNPCTSIYKAFFMGGNSLKQAEFKEPSAKYDNSFWWQAEKLNRQILKNYHISKSAIDKERSNIQNQFIEIEKELTEKKVDLSELDQFSKSSLDTHKKIIKKWQKDLSQIKPSIKWYQFIYKNYYRKLNKVVGLSIK